MIKQMMCLCGWTKLICLNFLVSRHEFEDLFFIYIVFNLSYIYLSIFWQFKKLIFFLFFGIIFSFLKHEALMSISD